jgi:hypothetical protein
MRAAVMSAATIMAAALRNKRQLCARARASLSARRRGSICRSPFVRVRALTAIASLAAHANVHVLAVACALGVLCLSVSVFARAGVRQRMVPKHRFGQQIRGARFCGS